MAPRRQRHRRRSKRASTQPSSSSNVGQTQEASRNWLELPPEILAAILLRLGAAYILTIAQNVCRTWRKACKDPSMWRSIDMRNVCKLTDLDGDLETICEHAVDRSDGGLVDINVEHFGTDSLLVYIANRSSNLRRLRLFHCYRITDMGLIEAASKLPLLEELEISFCRSISEDSLRHVGTFCPVLKSFKLNMRPSKHFDIGLDEEALAIAWTMPQLHHLQLFGNQLTATGLNAILDHCLLLEHLDIRQCFNINLVGDLEKRCTERIKTLRRPNDPTDGDDDGFDAMVHDWVSGDEDYPYGFAEDMGLFDDDYSYEYFGPGGYFDYDDFVNQNEEFL